MAGSYWLYGIHIFGQVDMRRLVEFSELYLNVTNLITVPPRVLAIQLLSAFALGRARRI